jgi:hypothetical protein
MLLVLLFTFILAHLAVPVVPAVALLAFFSHHIILTVLLVIFFG